MKKFIVNHKTKEIHRIDRQSICKINKNRPKICWLHAMWLIWFKEYDGCKLCWPEKHKK